MATLYYNRLMKTFERVHKPFPGAQITNFRILSTPPRVWISQRKHARRKYSRAFNTRVVALEYILIKQVILNIIKKQKQKEFGEHRDKNLLMYSFIYLFISFNQGCLPVNTITSFKMTRISHKNHKLYIQTQNKKAVILTDINQVNNLMKQQEYESLFIFSSSWYTPQAP